MYFMATGRTLYRGDGPYSLIAQLCKGNYKPVREINSDIPDFVADVIDKLLETQPQHRFQSATQVVQQLESTLTYLHQPTIQKTPQRIWNSRKKRKLTRTISFGVAFSIVVVGVFAFALLPPWNIGQKSKQTHGTQRNGAPSFNLPSGLNAPEQMAVSLDAIEAELSRLEWAVRNPIEMNAGDSIPSTEVSHYGMEPALDLKLQELSNQLLRLTPQPAPAADDNGTPWIEPQVDNPGFSEGILPNNQRSPFDPLIQKPNQQNLNQDASTVSPKLNQNPKEEKEESQ